MPTPSPEPGRRQPGEPTSPRPFHLIGVGLPKTGTTTLAAIFERHRWGHEHGFEQAVDVLHAWRCAGTASETDVRDFWRARDHDARLACDSASFHHYVAPLLPDLFPDARFVLTVRDPAPWAASFVGMMVRNADRHGGTLPPWQHRIGELMIGSFDAADYADPARLHARLPDLLDRYLAHWAESTDRILAALPRARTLVLETDQLSGSLDALATWAGVPATTLVPSHANQAPSRERWLAEVPGLEQRVAARCGAAQTRLQSWLSDRPGPGSRR